MPKPITLDSEFAIVGAGIGGLSLAIALARKGAENLKLYERRTAPFELGAGLQLGPNAVRLLARLGVDDPLEKAADRASWGEMYDAETGDRLAKMPLDAHSMRAYKTPTYQLHRADLHKILLAQIQSLLGADVVAYETEMTALDPYAGSILFSNSSAVKADLIVGADGVDSSVRKSLFRKIDDDDSISSALNDCAAAYSGYLAWRGVVKASLIAKQDRSNYLRAWIGEGKHLLAYPIRGGELVNLVGVSEVADWAYSKPVVACGSEEWLEDYSHWFESANSIPRNLIGSVDRCQKWALRLIKPLSDWGKAKVVLLGDAAHPMLPSLAQGAGQAIEDAVVLADLVASGQYSSESIWREYQSRREKRVTRVMNSSRWNLNFFHQKKGVARAVRNRSMRLGGPITTHLIARKHRWLYKSQ